MTAAVIDLLGRAEAAGARLALEGDRVRFGGHLPADLLAELRQNKADVVLELRRRADKNTLTSTLPPLAGETARSAAGTTPEAAGELSACDREAGVLQRVHTDLGAEIDGQLQAVLGRLIDAGEVVLADRTWRHIEDALRRDILSKLVAWLRALDGVGADLHRVRALVEAGPGRHAYHDVRSFSGAPSDAH